TPRSVAPSASPRQPSPTSPPPLAPSPPGVSPRSWRCQPTHAMATAATMTRSAAAPTLARCRITEPDREAAPVDRSVDVVRVEGVAEGVRRVDQRTFLRVVEEVADHAVERRATRHLPAHPQVVQRVDRRTGRAV